MNESSRTQSVPASAPELATAPSDNVAAANAAVQGLKIAFSRNHNGAPLVLVNGKVAAIAKECNGWNYVQAHCAAFGPASTDRAAVISAAGHDVLAERRRQVEQEGWTPEHDDKYSNCELARAAATYALCSHIEQLKLCGEQAWPWHPDWWKRGSYRRDLVKAGALILAEIDRVDRDRAAAKAAGG